MPPYYNTRRHGGMDTKIDIVDFLDSIYIDMELWLKFQKRCHLDEVNASEILAYTITEKIQKALA